MRRSYHKKCSRQSHYPSVLLVARVWRASSSTVASPLPRPPILPPGPGSTTLARHSRVTGDESNSRTSRMPPAHDVHRGGSIRRREGARPGGRRHPRHLRTPLRHSIPAGRNVTGVDGTIDGIIPGLVVVTAVYVDGLRRRRRRRVRPRPAWACPGRSARRARGPLPARRRMALVAKQKGR